MILSTGSLSFLMYVQINRGPVFHAQFTGKNVKLDSCAIFEISFSHTDLHTIASADPISRVTRSTEALKTSNCVYTISICVAVVRAINTLILI